MMASTVDYRSLHQQALASCSAIIAGVVAGDLIKDTPCAGWDLRTLLGHCIGQNHGFAAAVENGNAGKDAYAHRSFQDEELQAAWHDSAQRLTRAFAAVSLNRIIALAEFSPRDQFPAGVVIGFHLLDTVVHSWDIATSLGRSYRPADELVDATFGLAQQIPQDLPARQRPGAAFAPVLANPGADPWAAALALLGRKEP